MQDQIYFNKMGQRNGFPTKNLFKLNLTIGENIPTLEISKKMGRDYCTMTKYLFNDETFQNTL